MIRAQTIPAPVIDEWPIAEAGLPCRVVNALHRTPVRTVGALRGLNHAELRRTRGIGPQSVKDIGDFFSRWPDRFEWRLDLTGRGPCRQPGGAGGGC